MRGWIYLAFLMTAMPVVANAWSATGHMVTAAIAYRDMAPTLQKKYVEILKQHPDYAKWVKSHDGKIDRGAYLFMRAGVWPDELKQDRSNPDTHPEWHYINYPLRAPQFSVDPAPTSKKGDILTAIWRNQGTLDNSSSSPKSRAIALAWLIHLVGDIHQPLHTTALINSVYKAPKGDMGGNGFYIRPSEKATRGITLHSFWDGLLGTSKNYRAAWNDAIELQSKFPKSKLTELAIAATARDWSLESREIAITTVYQGGKLAGTTKKRADQAAAISQEYRSLAERTAEKRVALAGYRLSSMLK